MSTTTKISKALDERVKRTQWFTDARFGMFIHWGLYAIPARGEWVRAAERLTVEDYQQYFDEFNPVRYNPEEWAQIAKDAGMKYAILTAKHHDGFCLFDSKLTEYKSTNTPAKRDLVAEYVEAFRKKGIKVGLYYSLVDWHHEDYPAYGDRQHPMRENEEYKDKKHNLPAYIEYMHGQVRELLTNYGKIDIMWFDFSYGNMTGEAWRATDLVKMVRSLQPEIIIDDRLGGNIRSKEPEEYSGDFAGPERGIPAQGITNEIGNPLPWEACITLNNRWGYCSTDKQYKTPELVIKTLVDCVSKGGNLLLNIGPNALGEIPEESIEILKSVGKWMNYNGESIYGCGHTDLPQPQWGRYTAKDGIVYAHVLDKGVGQIPLYGLKGKIKKARLLCDGSEVILSGHWNSDVQQYEEETFMNFGKPVLHTFPLPDKKDTVVKLVLT